MLKTRPTNGIASVCKLNLIFIGEYEILKGRFSEHIKVIMERSSCAVCPDIILRCDDAIRHEIQAAFYK